VFGGPRRGAGPDGIRQLLDRYYCGSGQGEYAEDGTLARPTDRQHFGALVSLDRAEHSDPHPSKILERGLGGPDRGLQPV
jgi:hypothetical protein